METRWGKRFGRYEVVAELGSGAMGVVYKARDPKIDRFVAVKTISLSSQNPEEQREYRERFFLEAQAAGRLLHPGIVTIFDTGEDPDGHIAFIVMEFIAGQSLERLLSEKTKKLPLDTALLLTQELAEALDHAHGQGVAQRCTPVSACRFHLVPEPPFGESLNVGRGAKLPCLKVPRPH